MRDGTLPGLTSILLRLGVVTVCETRRARVCDDEMMLGVELPLMRLDAKMNYHFGRDKAQPRHFA
jgi:hypothetical protein